MSISIMSCFAQLQDLHLSEHPLNLVCTRVPVYKPNSYVCIVLRIKLKMNHIRTRFYIAKSYPHNCISSIYSTFYYK